MTEPSKFSPDVRERAVRPAGLENLRPSTPTANRICSHCGSPLQADAGRRNRVDVLGASLLGLVVVGIAALFADVFGSSGGRYTLIALIGIPGVVIWAVSRMVGPPEQPARTCAACGRQEAASAGP